MCDLKALVKFMGIYACNHPKAKWRCPWCLVQNSQLADFGIQRWPLQRKDWDTINRGGLKRAKENFARNNAGIIGTPTFEFAMDHVLPCRLHFLMAVTRKLYELLMTETFDNPALEEAFLGILASLKLKLVKETSDEGKKRTFLERVKKSRFGRPEYLRIIELYQDLIAVLERGANTETQQAKVEKTKVVWQQYHRLISVAVQPKVNITEKQWLQEALPFGNAFIARYAKQDVTTYIHIFRLSHWLLP